MKKHNLIFSLCIFLIMSGNIISQVASNGLQIYEAGKLYLQLKSTSNVTITNAHTIVNDPGGSFQALFTKYQATTTEQPFAFANNAVLNKNYKITFNQAARVDSFIIDLSQISVHVAYAEKVAAVYTFSVPNDPLSVASGSYLPSFYYLPLLNANAASNIYVANGGATVAIVDDAVLTTHQDLAANIGAINRDVADNDNDPNPFLALAQASLVSHGTRLAGIAGAVTNNSVGIASIGWNNKLMCVKASSDNPQTIGHLTNPYAGVLWAAQNGANVINMSWGNFAPGLTDYQAITLAKSYNVVLVAAVGNDMSTVPTFPAAYGEGVSGLPGEVYDKKLVVAVAALDQNSNMGVWTINSGGSVSSYGSNFGNWVDISAYGSAIPSTSAASTHSGNPINNQYGPGDGTSFAAPMIAGIVGIMRSYNPSKTADEIIDCLINTANPDIYGSGHPANPSGLLGSGRADAAAALRCISSACSVNPIVIIVPSAQGLCSGGSVTLTANQGANSYSWSTGATTTSITVSTAGVYTVIGTYTAGGGCTAIGSITIAPPPTLSLSVTSNTSLCPGGYVSVISASGSFNSLIWQPGGLTTNSIIANFSSATIFTATANQYCGGSTATISVAGPTATPIFGTYAPYAILGPTLSASYANILNNNGHFVILADASVYGQTNFNFGEIILGPNVKITVPATGTLNINSSYLHSCGTDLWKGIVVENSGVLNINQVNSSLNSPLIEDAITAISSIYNSTIATSPIIKISHAIFNKNYIDISLSGFNDAGLVYSNILKVDNSVFTCRYFAAIPYNSPIVLTFIPSSNALRTSTLSTTFASPYLTTYTTVNLKNPYNTQPSHIAVNLATVGITTGSPAVTNGTATMLGISVGDFIPGDFNLFDNHGSFIVSNRSNVTLSNNTFQNTQTYTISGGTTFGGSAVKHSAGYTSSNAMHTLLNMSTSTVSGAGNNFYNCHTAIDLNNTYLFSLENAFMTSAQSSGSGTVYLPGNTGIYAATNNFDYYIANNVFTNLKNAINIPISTGIILPANISASNPVVTGIFAHRIRITNNVFAAGSGTTTFMDRAVDLTCPNSLPWQSNNFVVPSVSISPFPQAFSVSNNTLTDVYTGISANGSHGFQVDLSNNNISLKDNSTAQFAISLLNCNPTSSTSIGKNLITSNTAGFSASSATSNSLNALVFCGSNGYGIFSPSVSCNVLKQSYAGFVFDNSNQQAVWTVNEMQLPMQKGMVLQNSGVIGVQGGSTTATANSWTGGTWSGVNKYQTYTSSSSFANLSVLWVRNVAGLIPTNSDGVPTSQSYAAIGNYTYVGAGSGDYNCTGISNNKNLHIPVAGQFTSGDLFYMSKMALYRFLNANDSVINSGNAGAITFLNGQTGSSIEAFTQIEKYLYQGTYSTAISLNSAVTATNTIESNYKSLYTLYAAYGANNFDHTNSTDQTALSNLATLCPGTNGACVYQAIALYNRVYKTILSPSCLPIGQRVSHLDNASTPATQGELQVSIYPNPATNAVTLFANAKESQELLITITDISGRKIYNFRVITKDFISKLDLDLVNGSYLIQITDETNKSTTKKLLISK